MGGFSLITYDHTGSLIKWPILGCFAGSSGGQSSVAVRSEDSDTVLLCRGGLLRKPVGQTFCLGQTPEYTKVERTVQWTLCTHCQLQSLTNSWTLLSHLPQFLSFEMFGANSGPHKFHPSIIKLVRINEITG